MADCFQLALESLNMRGQLGCVSFNASSGMSSPIAAAGSFSCGSFQLQLPWGSFSDGVPAQKTTENGGLARPVPQLWVSFRLPSPRALSRSSGSAWLPR